MFRASFEFSFCDLKSFKYCLKVQNDICVCLLIRIVKMAHTKLTLKCDCTDVETMYEHFTK